MRRVLTLLAPLVLLSGTFASGLGPAASAVAGVYHRPVVRVGRPFNDTVGSTNWSGYAVETSSTARFAQATGSWTEPSAVSCSRRGSTYSSFWVGLDGYSSDSVEQIGTDTDCSSGRPQYYAWYEMYPNPSYLVPHTVKAGDTLTATVTNTSPGSYTLTLTDAQQKWTFTTVQAGTYADASAEWVAESPSLCSRLSCTVAQLTDFGTVTFGGANAATTGGSLSPVSSFTTNGGPHDIVMVTSSGTTIRALPGALSSTGTGFSDTWYHS
jgi:Peptidase A4 family